jgi:uncharacterized membrane protein (DUF4010 family)
MTPTEALVALAVAVAAGGLIGAEREQAHGVHASDFGGVRTFPLLAIVGVLAGCLRPALGAWFVGALLFAVVVALAIAQLRSARDDIGVSSEIAAIVTFALGVMSATPELLPDASRYLLVAAVAAVTMALLALKRPLHGFVAKLSSDDVYATVKFVLLALVVLPLLPDRAYGPFAVLNPRKIGLMIVLVAGVSFAGYVAARLVGSRRGLLVAGLLGGLVSSTALTVALAGRAKEDARLAPLSAVGIMAGCATMFPRVVLIAAVVDRSLLVALAPSFGAMTVVAYGAAFRAYAKSSRETEHADVEFRNPFELSGALQFGLLYAGILFVARAAQHYVGTAGVYVSAALAGLADVDAITLSLADLHRTGSLIGPAAPAITLAALVNTLTKGTIATVLGGKALGRGVLPGLVLTVTLGLLAVPLGALLLR